MRCVYICYAVVFIANAASTQKASPTQTASPTKKKDRGCNHYMDLLVKNVNETDEFGRLFLNKFVEGSGLDEESNSGEKGNRGVGKNKSKVEFFEKEFGVEAYSGYFKVDPAKPKNFYFFLVKSKITQEKKAPLILWLNGGPGQTSLFGQFMENGPVGIDKEGKLYNRSNSLHEDYDILYLDQPVGAGFSFPDNVTAYPTSLEDIASDMEKFLCLFFKLFKEYLNVDLYIGGESYGVRSAAAFGVHLLRNMTGEKAPPAKLKGVMCGVGLFTETLRQVDTSDLLLNLGLVDQHGYNELKKNIEDMKKLVENATTVRQALGIYTQTFGTTTNFSDPKFRLRRTGFLYNGNALKPTDPDEHLKFVELMNNKTFRQEIHAGENATFRGRDSIIMMKLLQDLYRSIDKELEFLLNNGTKVLVFLGQLDLKVSNVVTEKFVRELNWTGGEDFNKTEQKPWWGKEDEKDFSGYFTSKKVEEGRKLMLVKLLTSGHYPFFDQPQASTEMVRRFINDTDFITKTVNKSGVYETDKLRKANDEL